MLDCARGYQNRGVCLDASVYCCNGTCLPARLVSVASQVFFRAAILSDCHFDNMKLMWQSTRSGRALQSISMSPFFYVATCYPLDCQTVLQIFKGEAKQKHSLAWTWFNTAFVPTRQTLSVTDLDHSKSLSAGSLSPCMYTVWTKWLKVDCE